MNDRYEEILSGFLGFRSREGEWADLDHMQIRVMRAISLERKGSMSPKVLINRMKAEKDRKEVADAVASLVEKGILGMRRPERIRRDGSPYILYIRKE